MKKIFAMTAIAAAIAMPASAQMYVGAGLGSSSNENANGIITTTAPAVATNFSLDKSKSSWKLLAGAQLTPNWGIEAQYTDLGQRDITLMEIGGAGRVGRSSIDAEQYSIAGTGKYYFSPGFFVHGKLGVTGNKLSNSNTCLTGAVSCVTSGSETNTGFLWGFGLGHDFTKNWSVKGGYENFGKILNDVNGKSVTMSNMGVNVIYSF